jgi:hypothetical protein
MNSAISKPHPNIFKLIDLLKEHEQSAAISFEKANLGQVKSRRTKEDLKDKEIFFLCVVYLLLIFTMIYFYNELKKIEILKLKYETGIIDSMDFLMAVSSFVKDFE